MYQILIKGENGDQTHNTVDTCDVGEVFASGKAIKVSVQPEKTRKVLKTLLVDVKKTTFDKGKFHESPDAEWNSLKHKF